MNTTNDSTPKTDAAARRTSGFIYACIRRVHLYSGLILLTFITMYFVTGIALVHGAWFGEESPPVETVTTRTLEDVPDPGSPDFGPRLAAMLDIPGRYSETATLNDGRSRVTYFRPGLFHEVTVSPDGSARVMRRELGFRQTLVGFHRMHGFGGGAFFTAWGVMMDLVNVALIVFAVTGIYMWWKLSKRHTLGWIVLAASYGYAAAIIGYLWLWP